jgi:hypothetical protein
LAECSGDLRYKTQIGGTHVRKNKKPLEEFWVPPLLAAMTSWELQYTTPG